MSILETLRNLAPDRVTVTSAAEWQRTQHPTLNRARPAVDKSDELSRVLAIPRRPPLDLESPRALALVELMTSRLKRQRADQCLCQGGCIDRLKPAQAWALYEAPLVGGLLAPVGVGHGKTLLDILMPLVMPNCKRAVLLIPPGLREQLIREYERCAEHFKVPSLVSENYSKIRPGMPVLHVVPFSKFSRHEATDLLERELKPDLLIIDEAHKARHKETASTSRLLRYLAKYPETRLCAWSGTLTAKSIKDYSHLSAFALKDNSPLPLDPSVVEEWALAIDPSDWPAPMGALSKLCDAGEPLHSGFYRRLTQTMGVVATKAGAVDAAIIIKERKAPAMPEKLVEQLANLRAGWVRPDGEELVDLFQVARSARELACGFFYRWKFPRGEPEEVITEWFAARKEWHKELRQKLQLRREHLDSPFLCTLAAIRAYQEPHYEGDLPVWKSDTWRRWLAVRDTVDPVSEAVWIDDYLAKDAASWATKTRGIVWYEHDAFGRRVAELSGLPQHAGGADAESLILAEKGDRSIIASIKAHGTGRDGLQRLFAEQLVANPPASGSTWEQLLGRLHRLGQRADDVQTFVYRHTDELRDAIDKAIIQAKYIQNTLGTWQKLLSASYDWEIEHGNF